MKSNGIRIKAMLAACALVLSLTLTSCTAFMKEASLDTTVNPNGCLMPIVSGFLKNDSINEQLSETFAPVAEQMKQITDDSEGRLQVEYRLTQSKKGVFSSEYKVMMILTDGRESMPLRSVIISGIDSVTPSGNPEESDIEWLNSSDLAEAALILQRLGVDFNRQSLSEYSTERGAVETFVALYEGIAGREADISEVRKGDDGLDDATKKALLLNLISCYDEFNYHYESTVYISRMVDIIAQSLTAIERDVYGRQSETVTGEELARLLRTFHSAMRVHEQENTDYRWSDLGSVNLEEILETVGTGDNGLTRRDAAEIVGRITRNGPKYAMNYTDRNLEHVDDSYESIWVRRAVTHGFMNYYGDSTLFGPDEGLTVVNAISSARCYMSTRFNDWAYSVNYAWDGNYTNSDVIIAAAQVARYFDDRDDAEKDFEVKTVINDRDYNWFYSQKNTGQYSGVNCMPSIATMASHWYDENSTATVRKMRETGGTTDGWTAYELRYALAAYDIPYVVEDVSLENITKALDRGYIVLAQYSDRPYGVSGHCYVIYGYRQFRNSTTFIVNDSDSLSYRALVFGREMGNGDEIEANFSLWTISRFVTDVTIVGTDSDNY